VIHSAFAARRPAAPFGEREDALGFVPSKAPPQSTTTNGRPAGAERARGASQAKKRRHWGRH